MTPRSRSTMFPSLREDMAWWDCRSRSPLSFPSRICKNHGREGKEWQAFQGQQWRRERGKLHHSKWGRRGPYIGPPRKIAVGNDLSRSLRACKTGVSGLGAESPGPRLRGRLRGNFQVVLDIRPESWPESWPESPPL